jgi:hypothetical protein
VLRVAVAAADLLGVLYLLLTGAIVRRELINAVWTFDPEQRVANASAQVVDGCFAQYDAARIAKLATFESRHGAPFVVITTAATPSMVRNPLLQRMRRWASSDNT